MAKELYGLFASVSWISEMAVSLRCCEACFLSYFGKC